MRTFTIVLACVTAVVLLLVGYQFFTCKIGVEIVDYSFEDVTDNSESFEVANNWILDKNYDSLVLYKNEPLGDMSNYIYVYVNVRLTNRSMLPAEWILIYVQPVETDALQFRQQPVTLGPFSTTQIQLVLLADKVTGKVRREAAIEYYMFGEYMQTMSSTPGIVITPAPATAAPVGASAVGNYVTSTASPNAGSIAVNVSNSDSDPGQAADSVPDALDSIDGPNDETAPTYPVISTVVPAE